MANKHVDVVTVGAGWTAGGGVSTGHGLAHPVGPANASRATKGATEERDRRGRRARDIIRWNG